VKNQRKKIKKQDPKQGLLEKIKKIKPTGARPIRKNQKIKSPKPWASVADQIQAGQT
jgi:hypothetical protein